MIPFSKHMTSIKSAKRRVFILKNGNLLLRIDKEFLESVSSAYIINSYGLTHIFSNI